ncbi:MAG: hypothetical protein QOG67_1894 [Verrucomicrobiota bacterium]|jgi:hypothetical protein
MRSFFSISASVALVLLLVGLGFAISEKRSASNRYQLIHGKVFVPGNIGQEKEYMDAIMRIDTTTGQTWTYRQAHADYWEAITEDPLLPQKNK